MSNFLDFSQPMTWAFALVTAGFIFALGRLILGPSLPDRVVALDLMGTLSIGLITLHAVYTKTSTYLDIAVTLALISFLGTIAFARFVEKQQKGKQNQRTK